MEAKTIRPPSGDHTGKVSTAAWKVNRVLASRANSSSQMSASPWASRRASATRFWSGDSLGRIGLPAGRAAPVPCRRDRTRRVGSLPRRQCGRRARRREKPRTRPAGGSPKLSHLLNQWEGFIAELEPGGVKGLGHRGAFARERLFPRRTAPRRTPRCRPGSRPLRREPAPAA